MIINTSLNDYTVQTPTSMHARFQRIIIATAPQPKPNVCNAVASMPIAHYPYRISVFQFHYSRMLTSTHGTRHSRLPRRLLSHSTPSPVHSARRAIWRFASSIAVPAKARAVLFRAPAYIDTWPRELVVRAEWLKKSGRMLWGGRGSNQLLLKSKKHWSDQ
jgi:hypothetical protein